MKKIDVKNGLFALVDDGDFELVMANGPWHIIPNRKGGVSAVVHSINAKNKLYLHRMLVKPPRGKEIDHIDGNPLNNQRSNLRVCTGAENRMNRGGFSTVNRTSKFKGVNWNETKQRWIAQIQLNKKKKHIGNFKSEADAALAYNEFAKAHFQDFARLNEV